MILRAALLPKQAEYVNSKSPVAIYAGGVGAGKTIADVMLAIKLMIEFPGIDGLFAAPTYGMLWDIVIKEFKARCPPQLLAEFRSSTGYSEAIFKPNKGKTSTCRFRAFDDAGKAKGPTYGFGILEEVTEMDEEVLLEVQRRLRQSGMPNFLRMATNPDSKDHYIYKMFIEPVENGTVSKDEIHYIHTTSFDNFTLEKSYLDSLRRLKKLRPGHFMRSVMGEWGDFHEDRIGAFEECEGFSTVYRVAFIDSSFSDKAKTDRTSCTIAAFSPQPGRDSRYWPIEFTGQSWEKSISNPDVQREMLLLLDQHKPIETTLESQLGDSTKVFIDTFREIEKRMALEVRNHWTVFHQSKNKHERIMLEVAGNKDRIKVLKGTDPAYLGKIVNYAKGAAHEDEIDSLAGAINQWRISKALAEFIRRMERQRR